MRLTGRDGVATLVVAAAVVIYGLWATGAALSGTSVRVLAAVLFGLGWVGCTSDGPKMAEVFGIGSSRRPPIAYTAIASLVGAGALAAGITALIAGSKAPLAALVAAMLVLWAMATVRHGRARPRPAAEQAIGEPRGRAG